jgi:enediyne biosynthesis protein E4
MRIYRRRTRDLSIAFLATLAWVGCGGPEPSGSAAAGDGADPAAEGLFEEVAAQSGLDFVHFNGMSGARYLVEVTGPGAGLFDADGDGDLDVYLVQGAMLGPEARIEDALAPPAGPTPPGDRLYRNDLTRTAAGEPLLRFTDVTAASGIVATGYGMGVAAGDVDNDGRIDLYVTNFGRNQLLHNEGDGRVISFRDVTEASGTGDERWSVGATFFDYDRDGWLDLYVADYVDFNYGNHRTCYLAFGAEDYCGPLSYQPVPDRLYRNQGDGTFADVSAAAGIVAEYRSGLGVVAADFDGDGWIDLYVANDQMPNLLWLNQRDGSFRDQALWAGCAVNAAGAVEASMGVDAADFDGDGDLDLFLTHLDQQTHTLYANDGHGFFVDVTAASGMAAASVPMTGFGARSLDVDNDGWLDVVAVDGSVKVLEEQLQAGELLPLRQPDQLFLNRGGGRFEDASAVAGPAFAHAAVSRGAAFGDVDDDGDVDVLVADNNGPVRLLSNRVGSRRPWLGLRLLDAAGRDAYGAVVEVLRDRVPRLVRRAAADGSYGSSNDPRVLFGLGEASAVRVRVTWPGGGRELFGDLDPGRYHTLRAGSGRAEAP